MGQKSRYSEAQLVPLLKVSQGGNQGASRAAFPSEGSRGECISRLIQAVSRIQVYASIDLMSCFALLAVSWEPSLSPGSFSLVLAGSHLCLRTSNCAMHPYSPCLVPPLLPHLSD